jgi:hypothetical protein
MRDHPVPNQSNRNTNEALTSLARLLAEQSVREMLSASLHEDIRDSAGKLSKTLDTSTVKTNSPSSATDLPEAE